MSDKLKGVWVEGRLWENKDFLLVEKHLLQKIHDLDNEHGCTAMNAWFAEFLGISKSRVSQLISKFKKDKLVSVKLKFEGKQVVGRVVNVLKGGVLLIKGGVLSANRPLSYTKHPPLAGSEESNIILLNNTISNLRESKKALTQENKNLLDQIKNLTAANLELKNKSEAQKEEPKSSAKKVKTKHEFPSNEPQKAYKANSNNFPSMSEFEEMPIHEDQIKKKYQLELSKFTYPSSWTEYLINQFLEWCAGKDEKLLGKFGSTQVKALIRKINGYLKDYDAKTIGDSIELSLSTPYNNFNPKWIIDRQEKEKQDEAKQTANNGKGLYESWTDIVNQNFEPDSNDKGPDTVDTSWAEA
jgi:predicted XRE-type DNA-binding protein